MGGVHRGEDAFRTQSEPRGGDDGHSGTPALSAPESISAHLQHHDDVLDGGNELFTASLTLGTSVCVQDLFTLIKHHHDAL